MCELEMQSSLQDARTRDGHPFINSKLDVFHKMWSFPCLTNGKKMTFKCVELLNVFRVQTTENHKKVYFVRRWRDFRLPLKSRWEVRTSKISRSAHWSILTDDSGQPNGTIVKGRP